METSSDLSPPKHPTRKWSEKSVVGVAPEGPQCFDRPCSQDVLVIGGRDRRSDKGPHPEDPLKIKHVAMHQTIHQSCGIFNGSVLKK